MFSPGIADMVSMTGSVGRDVVGAQIITKTLDTLNGLGPSSFAYNLGLRPMTGVSNTADYQFQTDVLNAAYSGIGTFVNTAC